MDLEVPEALSKNKKFTKFQNELVKVMQALEKAPTTDWASLNNGLNHVQKVIDSHKEFSEIPEKMLLFRVLMKCLEPNNVAGVHKKAVETVNKLCIKMGPEQLARNLPVLSVGIFALLPSATMAARPEILRCVETHFLPLPIHALRSSLGGLTAAILPTLEESETSDAYGQAMNILKGSLRRLEAEKDVGGGPNTTGPSLLYHTIWSSIRNAPNLRTGGLMFMRKLLPRAKAIEQPSETGGSPKYEAPSEIPEEMLGDDPTLVLVALNNAIRDSEEKVQRLALDTLVFNFPLHEDGLFSFNDRVELMTSALTVLVTNPSNSTLRRVFMWLYGGEHICEAYYREVSSRFVLQALDDMMEAFVTGETPNTYAIEAFVALQQRPEGEEHFRMLVDEFVPKLCSGIIKLGANDRDAASNPVLQRLFAAVPWNPFLNYILKLLEELSQLVAQDACNLKDASRDILSRISAIIEVTRAHFMPGLSGADSSLDLIGNVCANLCEIMRVLSEQRKAGAVDASEFSAFIRAGLEIFHVSYFGITRGVETASMAPTANQLASDEVSSPILQTARSERSIDSESSAPSAETTRQLFNTLTELYVSVVDAQILRSKAGADAIFSSDTMSNAVARDEIQLFAEFTDTVYFVLRQLINDQGSAVSPNRGEVGVINGVDDGDDRVPDWIEKTLQVISEGAAGVAVCASQLYMDVLTEGLLSPRVSQELSRRNAARRVVQRLWPLMVVTESHNHTAIAKLLMRSATHDDFRSVTCDAMEQLHPANCRQFSVLFRVLHEMNATEFPFLTGLLMMLSALNGQDGSMRLMAAAFVEQSMPYLQRVVVPLVETLVPARGEPLVPPPQDTLALFLKTMIDMHRTNPRAFVQRLLALPAPAVHKDIRQCLNDSRQSADEDFQVGSMFSLIALIALRSARREHHNSINTLLGGSTAVADEVMLRQPAMPAIQQGDDTRVCVLSLELLNDIVETAVGFSEPSEAVTSICNHLSIAALELLNVAVEARIPSAQVELLRLLRVTASHVDSVNFRRRAYSAQDDAADEGREGSPGLPNNRRRAQAKRSGDAAALEAFSSGVVFKVLRHGIISAALAELHTTMCCYGLLNYWTQTATALLPTLHSVLPQGVHELSSVYTDIIELALQRTLCPATAIITQRCFQGLTELVKFLFLPSTKADESFAVATGGNNAPDKSGFMSGFFGSNSDNEPVKTNYDLCMAEAAAAMPPMYDAAFGTFSKRREEHTPPGTSGNISTNAAAQPPINSTRQQVEGAIRHLVDVLIKEMEAALFQEVLAAWSTRTPLDANALVVSDPENCLVVDLLLFSSLVTPMSVLAVVDQLIVRSRAGAKNQRPSVAASAELPVDAAGYSFLLTYFTRCKGPDRLNNCLPTMMDLLLQHVATPPPSLQAIPLIAAVLEVTLSRYSTASGNTDFYTKDKRAATILCRLLSILASTPYADVDDSSPIILSMKLLATVVPTLGEKLFPGSIDRFLEASQQLFKDAIVPSIRNAMDNKKNTKVLQVAQRTVVALSMLEALIQIGDAAGKRFRLEVLELLFDQNFFRMPRNAVPLWREIFETLTTDRSLNAAVLQKFSTGNAPTSILSNLVTSHDEEAYARGRLLKRLGFYVFSCANLDREFIAGVRDRLSDSVRLFRRSGRQVAVRYALFVFRVLMTRIRPDQLAVFWPVVLPEIIRVLASYDAATHGNDYEYTSLALEAIKVVDFSIVILPAEFQVFRWVFLDDGGTATSPTDGTFVPLIRAMHRGDAPTETFELNRVRRDYPPLQELKYPTANLNDAGHQPLLSIPERCYQDIINSTGLANICSALSVASNAVSDGCVALPESLLAGSEVANTENAFLSNIVRKRDGFDATYVRWLLEAEFLHVGVAVAAGSGTSRQSVAHVDPLATSSNASPTAPQLTTEESEFIDVSKQ